MPGLVAILTPNIDRTLADSIIPMAELMCHEDFYKMEVFNDRSAPCTVARVHTGIVNIEAQPIFNEDRTIFVFMDGEIYARQELIDTIRSAQIELRTQSDAELILRLYEIKGERFVDDLNGIFLVILHDILKKKTIIANDCFGMCPAFYVQKEGAFFLASEIKSLLRCGQVTRSVNIEKLGQYFLYDGIMDDETLIKDVYRLPSASIWTYKEGEVTKRQYFDIASFSQNAPMEKQEFVEEIGRLFLKIMPRYAAGGDVALSLTGGWDTRAVLATAQKLGYEIPCITLGGIYRDSMDIILATKITAALNLPHTSIRLGKDFFEKFSEYARKAIFISDGFANVFQTHALYFFPRVRELSPRVLSGKYGSQTMGCRFLVNESTLEPAIFPRVYLDEMGPLEKYSRPFNFDDGRAIINAIRWFWATGYAILQGCYVEERFPYIDRDLVSLLFSAPQSYMENSFAQKYIVSQYCPPLADFPTDKGKFIPNGNLFRDSRLDVICMLIKMCIKLDRPGVHPRRDVVLTKLGPILAKTRMDRLYLGRMDLVSYRHWVEYELKGFFLSILQDERTLSRPYLNPDFLRKMIAAHFSHRANYVNEICKIVSLELWHQHFIDMEPSQHGWQQR